MIGLAVGTASAGCGGSADEAACKRARRSHSKADWNAYLSRHQQGSCAEEAADAIARLEAEEEAAAAARRAAAGAEARRALSWVHSDHAKVWFTRTEITVAQFQRCHDAGTCTGGFDSTTSVSRIGDMRRTQTECNYGRDGYGDHPMNCVSWDLADRYCAWLGARLPTRAEWIAEATAAGSRRFPWGDDAPSCDRAVLYEARPGGCGRAGTWPVCSKSAGNSPAGLCDMIGNVAEFTSSFEELADTSHGNASQVTLGGSYGTEPATSGLPPGRGCAGGTGTAAELYRNCAVTSEWFGFRCAADGPP